MKTPRRILSLLMVLSLLLGLGACGGNTPAGSEGTPSQTEAAPSQSQPQSADSTAASSEAQTTSAPASSEATTAEVTSSATEPASAQESASSGEPSGEVSALEPGYYPLYNMPTLGGPDAVAKAASYGVYYFFVIEEGGKGFFYAAGQESEISWDETGITVGGSRGRYEAEGGVLTLYNNNEPYMIFIYSDDPAPERGETLKALIGLTRTDEITLKDETLADTEVYTVTAKEIVLPGDPRDPYSVALTLTNKLADDVLDFAFSHVVINGISVPADSTFSVAAGKTEEFMLPISLDDMKHAGVGDPTRIDLNVRVTTQSDSSEQFLGYLPLFPLGEDKAEEVVHEDGETHQVLEDNKSVRLVYTGIRDWPEIGYAFVTFWVENKTDQTAQAMLIISALNETEAHITGSAFIAPESSGILEGVMSYESLSGLNPYEITNIELTFNLAEDSEAQKTITSGDYSFEP